MDKNLKFRGCDDPAGYVAGLDAKRARVDAVRARNAEKELAYIEDADAGRIVPWKGHGDKMFKSEADWKLYRDIRSAEIEALLSRMRSVQAFKSMPFGDMVRRMFGAKWSGALPDDKVDVFVTRTELELGLRLAPDYISYVRTFGRIAIGSVELSGFDPSGEYDTASLTLQSREILRPLGGIGDKYYLLGGVNKDQVSQLAYFQDCDGYVYELTDDGVFSARFESLRSYLVEMWLCTQEGAM